jgi:microcompartment protein CcmL/EutN
MAYALSEAASNPMQPALALLELDSVAVGIVTGDAMAKRAPISVLHAGTVHPGKYIVLVAGQVADVEEALAAGFEASAGSLLDHVFLAHVHPAIPAALTGQIGSGPVEALGIVETRTVATLLGAVDRGLKGADVALLELRLADDLGGKAYCLFAGSLTDIEAAMEEAVATIPPDALVAQRVIPRLHQEMHQNLTAAAELRAQLRSQES